MGPAAGHEDGEPSGAQTAASQAAQPTERREVDAERLAKLYVGDPSGVCGEERGQRMHGGRGLGAHVTFAEEVRRVEFKRCC
jgi:hypothetical protein